MRPSVGFRQWLEAQFLRTDAVGHIAMMALNSNWLPKNPMDLYAELYTRNAGEDMLEGCRMANREWRAHIGHPVGTYFDTRCRRDSTDEDEIDRARPRPRTIRKPREKLSNGRTDRFG